MLSGEVNVCERPALEHEIWLPSFFFEAFLVFLFLMMPPFDEVQDTHHSVWPTAGSIGAG